MLCQQCIWNEEHHDILPVRSCIAFCHLGLCSVNLLPRFTSQVLSTSLPTRTKVTAAMVAEAAMVDHLKTFFKCCLSSCLYQNHKGWFGRDKKKGRTWKTFWDDQEAQAGARGGHGVSAAVLKSPAPVECPAPSALAASPVAWTLLPPAGLALVLLFSLLLFSLPLGHKFGHCNLHLLLSIPVFVEPCLLLSLLVFVIRGGGGQSNCWAWQNTCSAWDQCQDVHDWNVALAAERACLEPIKLQQAATHVVSAISKRLMLLVVESLKGRTATMFMMMIMMMTTMMATLEPSTGWCT